MMDDTCILLTTFLRDAHLFQCIESIRQYYPDIAVYVADNGRHTDDKREFCKAKNCVYLELPFDLGVSGVRNEAMRRIPGQYQYIMVCEDDLVFSEASRIESLRAVLDAEPEVGIVGCKLKKNRHIDQNYEAMIRIVDETYYIERVEKPAWRKTGNVEYFLCDLILNVFLMRRRVWDDCPWDDQFKTALEHSDFFLSLNTKTGWKVAYTPGTWIYHKKEGGSPEYVKYRARPVGWELFAAKWNVKKSYSSWNPVNPIIFKHMGLGLDAKDFNLEASIRILEKHQCRWWLEAGTCLGVVRHNNFIGHDMDIDIGLPAKHIDLWDVFIREFQAAGFELYKPWRWQRKKIELSFLREAVKVDLFFFYEKGDFLWHGAFGPNDKGQWGDNVVFLPHVFSRGLFENLKEVFFRGKRCFIPNPPERYLFERYGPGWNIPDPNYKYWEDCKAIDRKFFKRNKVAFIGGVWDLFHIGHLNILERTKGLGKLVVGVLTDEAAMRYKPMPTIAFERRKRIIESLKPVDAVLAQNDRDPTADLEAAGIVPDYIVHGDDWPRCPGEEYVKRHGGKVAFFPYTKDISSTSIKQAIISQRSSPCRAVDKGEKIAIGIKTFFRDSALLRTLQAIKRHFPYPYRLYIADDSRLSPEKEAMYAELETDGHVVIRLPFASGLSLGRNSIVSKVQEKYVLIMDDDIEIRDGQSIENMLKVLVNDEELGLVAGMLTLENGNWLAGENYVKGVDFQFRGGMMYRVPSKKDYRAVDGLQYLYADQVVNFFMARRELFDEVQWDNRIKIEYEHMDFFLSLRKTRWKAAVCLDAKAVHQISDGGPEYNQHRRAAPVNYFLDKHDLHGVINRF